MLNPAVAGTPTPAGRVAGALTGYACGDALGLPYENKPPTADGVEEIETPRAAAQRVCGAAPYLSAALGELAGGSWRPPADGIGMDPGQTVVAALHCVRTAGSLRDALLAAVRLGGDTDTVAALVGGCSEPE